MIQERDHIKTGSNWRAEQPSDTILCHRDQNSINDEALYLNDHIKKRLALINTVQEHNFIANTTMCIYCKKQNSLWWWWVCIYECLCACSCSSVHVLYFISTDKFTERDESENVYLSFFLPHDSYKLNINKSTPFPVKILTKKLQTNRIKRIREISVEKEPFPEKVQSWFWYLVCPSSLKFRIFQSALLRY